MPGNNKESFFTSFIWSCLESWKKSIVVYMHFKCQQMWNEMNFRWHQESQHLYISYIRKSPTRPIRCYGLSALLSETLIFHMPQVISLIHGISFLNFKIHFQFPGLQEGKLMGFFSVFLQLNRIVLFPTMSTWWHLAYTQCNMFII